MFLIKLLIVIGSLIFITSCNSGKSEEEISNIQYYPIPELNWSKLKEEFTNMEFNSIVSKDKTWNKFITTFER